MATSKNKSRRRLKPSHIYSIISTALVLFVVGILFLILLHGKKLSEYFRESISFAVILKDKTKDEAGLKLLEEIKTQPWVKSAEFINKEKAQEISLRDFGTDYREVLDENPLYSSVEIFMLSQYTEPDSLTVIQQRIMQYPNVEEFYYDTGIVSLANKSYRSIGYIILALSILLGFVAYTLIDSTIRLAMYSQRFLLRSMQLVGATNPFIRRPFLMRGMLNGFLSGIIAVALLISLLNLTLNILPDLKALQDFNLTVLLFALIIFLGIIFSVASSYFVVNKYLRMHLDELY